MAYLEHVNITVSDIEKTAALYSDLFGWNTRWRGPAPMGGETLHLGTKNQYIALYQNPNHNADTPYAYRKGVPLNHIGIVVDDLDAVEEKVVKAGFKPYSHGDYEPGRRFYFFDQDGIEVEVISYD